MLITFIGGGNMATALISGLMKSRDPDLVIRVTDPSEEVRLRLVSTFEIVICDQATEAVQNADVIVLAVKPQIVPTVLADLVDNIEPGQLVLSIAAGTTLKAMARQLKRGQAIVRSMPNTPALLGEGITGICPGEHCRSHHREHAERVLEAAGEVIWVEDESLMDAVTAISGSGPAYFFLLAEALTEAGIRLGLPEDVSCKLAEQTCSGAGAMLKDSSIGASELRHRVTSPGGTTEAALEAFLQGNFSELVYQAAFAAERRGLELSQ